MTSAALTDWENIRRRLNVAQDHLPEIDTSLTGLIDSLAFLAKCGRCSDRRLLGIDVHTLLSCAEDVAEMRERLTGGLGFEP